MNLLVLCGGLVRAGVKAEVGDGNGGPVRFNGREEEHLAVAGKDVVVGDIIVKENRVLYGNESAGGGWDTSKVTGVIVIKNFEVV